MIHLIGINEVYRNLAVLSALKSKTAPKTSEELELGFHSFLKGYQPNVPRLESVGTQIVEDPEMEDKLVELYRTDALLNDRDQSSLIGDSLKDDVRKQRLEFLLAALEELKLRMPQIYAVFQMAIDSLFLRDSKNSGGGSTSNAVGVIWINSRKHWHVQDLTELLVHELTHNLVFIDELRYLHFHDYKLLQNEANFAKSAILNIKRPIDKVFHSIVVAVEVLLVRRNYLGEPEKCHVHPPSDKMLIQALEALNSLADLPNYKDLITERGQSIMQKCQGYLDLMVGREKKLA
ncbi:aKG-HExxH-type peptide beta-hydroxylase [Photorhabdus sp. RM96S]|uniref:aKG-HExxH-type peptide beta-hydroxylase n=1 Tax=Photorhabdus sp. RM96S TaxID=3342822 RepID=UPI0036DF8713